MPVQRCGVCNRPSVSGLTHFRCKSVRSIDGIWAMARYQGAMRVLIHRYKYRYEYPVGRFLGEMLWERLPLGLKIYDLVVPVPLFTSRYRWRGFNQAEILAEVISKQSGGLLLRGALVRTEYTTPQAHLHKSERTTNLKHTFALVDEKRYLLKNKRVLLIDDVSTTGTTLAEAARILKQAGATVVWGCVLAR